MLTAVLVLSGLGVTAALGLGYAARKFHVETDPRLDELKDMLPQANCGACGQPGCAGFAEKLFSGGATVTECPVSDDPMRRSISEFLGVEFVASERQVAFVRCQGAQSVARNRFDYFGARTCRSATDLKGGVKTCPHGCVGFGDCAVVCDYGAIDVSTGVARIIEDKCTGCRMCLAACPTGVIGMKPLSQRVLILCASLEKGKATMAACDVGCIGCKKCVKVCPENAITVENFLATINPVLCTSCGKCVESCPTNAIYEAGRGDGKSQLKITPPSDPAQAAQMRAELESPTHRPVV